MEARQPTSKCLICGVNDSTQKNSHIVPACLIKSMIGKRYKEHSFVIDTKTARYKEYYGRDRLDNPSTEIKEHTHARDFYFCPGCEHYLGKLEGKICPSITDELRDPKKSGNYLLKNLDEVTYKELLKISSDDFNVFFLSIIYRQALQRKIDDGISVLSDVDFETIRVIISSYLSDDKVTYKRFCDQFGLMIFTANSVDKDNSNMTTHLNWKRPYAFIVNEFLVLVYSATDISQGKNQPDLYSYMLTIISNPIYPKRVPNIFFLPDVMWSKILGKILNEYVTKPIVRRLKKIRIAFNVAKQVKKDNKKKNKVLRNSRRASKRKK
jgi:hypothetical protein